MSKGDDTRDSVLRVALAQSSRVGLRGITIGSLADALEMSKSGLFAHFGSKEGLQAAVMDYAAESFTQLVIRPALRAPRGEPRLRLLFERWLGWGGYADYALPGGCIFVSVASEFDDEPDGPVRAKVVQTERDLLDTIETIVRGGVTEGQFDEAADAAAFAHDMLAIVLGYNFSARLLRDPAAAGRAHDAFDRLIDHIRS
ncbi:DNA-binding transcriptional regulator, AcrR family [Pedococcus dokdonensis]|uniref:DNA-binding transcriptional regulator, AcrR family n=1 Tax=Pedococcus dokdonensis TaxID=443156 RepID=A0A1H0RM91_9MICO|nr:TetR/AcrR family transcriptional regulator [Pedococcus dokdonensis]SDP30593.1 DNA-binding transcriptional regulator, AcrR family [Pedococcus dokdonensis]